ncbi:hypothetical protein HDU97_002924, partial [Phlyctochytrium planicorne]
DDQLATALKSNLHVYAYGGAVANVTTLPPNADNLFRSIPDLPGQVDIFLKDDATVKALDPESTLYTVYIGGNDYIGTLFAGVQPKADPIIKSILTELNLLASSVVKAKYISIWTLGNIWMAPVLKPALDDKTLAVLKDLNKEHNKQLLAGLAELEKKYGITFFVTETEPLFDEQAAIFGLVDSSTPCIVPVEAPAPASTSTSSTTPTSTATSSSITSDTATTGSSYHGYAHALGSYILANNLVARQAAKQEYTICPKPDTYLYWDNIHPTVVGHSVLGNSTLRTLEKVLAAKYNVQTSTPSSGGAYTDAPGKGEGYTSKDGYTKTPDAGAYVPTTTGYVPEPKKTGDLYVSGAVAEKGWMGLVGAAVMGLLMLIDNLQSHYSPTLHMYAYGGSVASLANLPPKARDNFNQVPELSQQVDAFESEDKSSWDMDKTLVTLFSGGNDYFGSAAAAALPDTTAIAGTVVSQAKRMVERMGVKHLVMLTMPPLTAVPAFKPYLQDPRIAPFIPVLENLAVNHNKVLQSGVDEMLAAHPDLTIYLADLYNPFQDIIKNPSSDLRSRYSLAVVDQLCLDNNAPNPPAVAKGALGSVGGLVEVESGAEWTLEEVLRGVGGDVAAIFGIGDGGVGVAGKLRKRWESICDKPDATASKAE